MRRIIAIILAAGKGTRMKSNIPKVLHGLLGRPIISYVLDAVIESGINYTIIIAGHGSRLLAETVRQTKVLVQKELSGSASAVMTAKRFLKSYTGDILVSCGDAPLIKSGTIKALTEKHKSEKASLTILTAELQNPAGYGRIVRNDNKRIVKILEEGEAGVFEKAISEVNAGTYCFKAKDLFDALAEVKPDNKKKEFFLTDTVAILHKKGKKIESVTINGPDEMIGINTKRDLARAAQILKNNILEEMMTSGVTVEDPPSTTIYPGVKIKADTVIHRIP